jgi:transcriptional regulator with XRE-family HTH domain
MITPVQCKMARAATGWGVRDLAAQANIGVSTVTRLESGDHDLIPATLSAIVLAFSRNGIEFTPATSEFGEGVRMKIPRAASK